MTRQLTNVEIHYARIRYQIALAQYDREVEKLFQASYLGLGKHVTMPSATMMFWHEVMAKMEATGWYRLVK